jgi:DNA repair protein SbcC/Rad50
MRLHSLALQAIGPYATEQRIDFDRLAAGGLFLLEGPTGSGKTTILDAITFALYGGLAGDGSGTDRLHSAFARPDVEPSVTLELSLRGVRYRVDRVPEYQRPKKRGAGYTTSPMRVHLQRGDGSGWVSLSSNKAECGDLITTAVGLNREQFTQVMLLPQGEFAKFLRCGDDDRRKVLTKLFGTSLYDQITAELDRRRRAAEVDRQAARDAIQTAVAATAEAAGLEADARGEVLALPSAERAVRFKEISEELVTALAHSQETRQQATSRRTEAAAADERAKLGAGLMSRLTDAVGKLGEHEDTRPEYEQRATLLARAHRGEPVRPLLAALAEAENEVMAGRRALRNLVPDPDQDMLAGRGGPAAAERGGAREREAASLRHLVDAEATLPDRDTVLAGLQATAAAASARAGAVDAARQDLPDRIVALEYQLVSARSIAATLEAASQQRDSIAAQIQAADLLAEVEPLLAEQEAVMRAAIDVHQRLVDSHQALMDARLEGIAAELAAGLADGIACPVCGSSEHPTPATEAAAAVTEHDVAAARERRDLAADERARAEEARRTLALRVAECAAVTTGRSAIDLTDRAAEIADRLAQAERAASDLTRLEPMLADLRAEQEQLGAELVSAAADAATALEQADQATADLARVRAELGAATQGFSSVAARQDALILAATADRDLGAALDQLAGAGATQDQARRRAEAEALDRGFATLELAKSAVLAPDRLAALDDQVTSWITTLAGLRSAAQAPELAGLDPERADEVHSCARRAAADHASTREAEQDARTACDAQTGKVERLGKRLGELDEAERAADALAAATDPVIHLAALARGMDGNPRVALTTYVLRHWFAQVVEAANVRLSAMSSSRYELRRTDVGETKRERSGLTLSVLDRHTGQERSPSSLSGGETFYTSLSLALGLADVVKAEAGGVDLETLFIDEGFGSLDAQTLDQVLAVIDELRDRGRAVGIVSHVADLKDRVAERLEVRRLPDGSSTVQVVA